jgi:hypothetical protein
MSKPVRKRERGPVYTAKQGGVSVPVYARQTRGYDSWEVPDYSTGKRRLRAFSDFKAAKDEANRLVLAVARGEITAAAPRAPGAASYGRALELLRPTGVSLEVAASEYAEAHKLLGGSGLIEAVRFAVQRRRRVDLSKSVEDVAEELIKARARSAPS